MKRNYKHWLKHVSCILIVLITMVLYFPGLSLAGDDSGSSSSPYHTSLEGLSFEMLAYLDFSMGQTPLEADEEDDYSSFRNTRGYFTAKKAILPWLNARLTLDLHQISDGDYEIRYKYLYAELSSAGGGPFTDLKSELGMGHIPWLDFEEHINPYRCQGTMPIERAGVFNSADLGVSLRGNFGGKLENAKVKTGSSSYDGRWGSWHLGIYNGSGYHGIENNVDKPIEARLTLRPIPGALPGLQLSYFGIFGKGNIKEDDTQGIEAPNYNVNLAMLSFEHPRFILTGQYFTAEGNAKGEWIDADGDALKTEGYSAFFRVKLPVAGDKLSLWARYDHFDADADHVVAEKTAYDLMIGSLTWDFHAGNLLLLTYETTTYEDDNGGKGKAPSAGKMLGNDNKIQLVWQIKV